MIGGIMQAAVGLANNITNAALTADSNRQDYARWMQERQWAIEDRENERQYMSPSAQMQRYIDAGLNPDLLTGQVAQPNITTRNSPAPEYRPVQFDVPNLLAFMQMEEQVMNARKSREEADSRIALNDAHRRLYEEDAQNKNIQSAIDTLWKTAAEEGDYFTHIVSNLLLRNTSQRLKNWAQWNENDYLEQMYPLLVSGQDLKNKNIGKDTQLKGSMINLNTSTAQLKDQIKVYYDWLSKRAEEDLFVAKVNRPDIIQARQIQVDVLVSTLGKIKSEIEKNKSRESLNEMLEVMKAVEVALDAYREFSGQSKMPTRYKETYGPDGDLQEIIRSYEE